MNKILEFIAKYFLFIYLKYVKPINEDIYIYKNKFVPIAKAMIILCDIYIWIASIIFFPFFIIVMYIDDFIKSTTYKNILKTIIIK